MDMDYLVESFRASDPVRQGDVFRLTSDDGVYGILVTADCDISNSKHGGELTLILAYPPSRYLRDFWCRMECGRLKAKLSRQVLEAANQSFVGRGGAKLLDEDGLQLLLSTFEPEALADRLKFEAGKKREEFLEKIEALKLMDVILDEEQFDILKKASLLLGHSKKTIESSFLSVLDDRKGPADIFHLPALPDLGHGPLIVRLRSFISISENDVGTSTVSVEDTGPKYIRCARLADNVRFAMIQKMAFLFSRIGLSADYENDLRSRLKATESEIVEEFLGDLVND
ncbi:hypothetical protein H9L12_02975 [Sphingomonas rhizophila]|uniref:Uncharacterized protein n=1 Tax=Sphingomonas rhizophila TaxID=2071607 RepID=A0A7G9SCI9_9SPHN|nr:hypothetical protein [Sphingomonas rhizophila]QNN65564.1 hypothetical protein H9L12_02975 [Sphingomonas rhizophila]